MSVYVCVCVCACRVRVRGAGEGGVRVYARQSAAGVPLLQSVCLCERLCERSGPSGLGVG